MFTFVGMDNALRLPVIHLTIKVVITLAKMIDCSSFRCQELPCVRGNIRDCEKFDIQDLDIINCDK